MVKQTVRNHGFEATVMLVAFLGAIASTAFITVNTSLGTVTEAGNTVAVATLVACAGLSWLAYLPGIIGLTLGTAEGN
jgi:hypothetical protein